MRNYRKNYRKFQEFKFLRSKVEWGHCVKVQKNYFTTSQMLFLLHLLSLLAIGVQSYNLDVQNFQLYEDPQANNSGRPSYFGFSVALYALGSDSVLLVGAPRANSTTMSDIIEPGVVYSCPLASNGTCIEWPIDILPQAPISGQTSSVKSRDHAWLGATISVQNITRPKVAVCAPRWTNVQVIYEKEKWFMNGMCYSTTVSNGSTFFRPAMRKHKPFSNDLTLQTTELKKGPNKGQFVYHQGMGQVGFSLHQTPDIHGDFVLGAPGFYRWTGTTVFIDERDQRDFRKAIIPNVVDDPHLDFDDYLGYSVTSGRFFKLSERLYASSAPRSSNLLGKVYIHSFPSRYASRFSFRKVFEGEQYGEYFGASLTSCDVNGDGRDDLMVGAPLWSKDSDEGRVYVYKSKGQTEFEVQKIEGEHEGGRFGTVVNCLNDLDFDGYADVAVGAPYEDDGRGAVYIFNGSPDGLSVQPSQRISAEDLSTNLRGLGISISEPRDVDGNRFPDVAFGAYKSGHAVVLRSRPVVTLNLKLVKSQNFTLMQNATYFVVDVCALYNGPFAPATFGVTKTLTIDEVHKRAIVYQNGRLFGNIYKVTSTLIKGVEKCVSVKINLKKNVLNVIDPIEIIGNLTLNDDPTCSECSVINPRLSKNSDNIKLAYILDCGEDDVCNSDLQVKVKSAMNDENNFIIGSNSTYNITILVENNEEPAYKTQVHVYIPLPITLARIPLDCDEKLELDKTLEVICNLDNPLRFNSTITMELDMRAIKHYEESNEIQVAVTTQSEEANLSNNAATLNINYYIDAKITIAGKTDGNLYSFEMQDVIDKNVKTITADQVYEIWKIGATPIQEAVVIINVPTHWKEDEITQIKQIRVSVDGQFHDCDVLLDEESNSTLHEIDMESETVRNHSNLVIPSEERTFFINCTDEQTTCQKFQCQLDPLLKTQSLATLTMTFDFQLPNATEDEYKGRDIIYFVSQGFVRVSNWNVTDNLGNDLFDYKLLATSFFIRHKPEQVALWIIILSVLLGIILIALLSLILIKIGFFNRKRTEDLNTLRSTRQLTVMDDE